MTKEVENSNENIDFQGLLMDQESFHLANAEQFKEIKNAMDRYYGSSIFKKMDDEGINNKVIMKETSDIITRKFSKKNLKLP